MQIAKMKMFSHRALSCAGSLPGTVLACFLLVSCASAPHHAQGVPKFDIQWPSPPLASRIVWLNEIHSYQDAAIGKGAWKSLLEFFTGEVETWIVKPYGVFKDDGERLFVADVGSARVHVMDMKAQRYSTIGEGGNVVFRSPIGITEDDAENLYVTDSAAGAVYRYSLIKNQLEPFIVSEIGRPTGIGFNRNNRLLYIADTTGHQIVVFDLRGNVRFRIGGQGDGPGQFNSPTDLFLDRRGRLYVTDALNARVSIFSAEGAHINSFGSPGDSAGSFAKPKGIAVDSMGNIYICDALLDAVQVFNDKGELLLVFGGNGTDAGQFWMPTGIYIDRNDNIYVADSYNRRVQVFKYVNREAPLTGTDKRKTEVNNPQ